MRRPEDIAEEFNTKWGLNPKLPIYWKNQIENRVIAKGIAIRFLDWNLEMTTQTEALLQTLPQRMIDRIQGAHICFADFTASGRPDSMFGYCVRPEYDEQGVTNHNFHAIALRAGLLSRFDNTLNAGWWKILEEDAKIYGLATPLHSILLEEIAHDLDWRLHDEWRRNPARSNFSSKSDEWKRISKKDLPLPGRASELDHYLDEGSDNREKALDMFLAELWAQRFCWRLRNAAEFEMMCLEWSDLSFDFMDRLFKTEGWV